MPNVSCWVLGPEVLTDSTRLFLHSVSAVVLSAVGIPGRLATGGAKKFDRIECQISWLMVALVKNEPTLANKGANISDKTNHSQSSGFLVSSPRQVPLSFRPRSKALPTC